MRQIRLGVPNLLFAMWCKKWNVKCWQFRHFWGSTWITKAVLAIRKCKVHKIPPKIQRLWISFLASPVKSAPSSISPRASGSWKLSSWYRLLPALFSLKNICDWICCYFCEDKSFKNLQTTLTGFTNRSGILQRLTGYLQNYFFKTWEDFAKVLPFMAKLKSHFSKCKVCTKSGLGRP